MITINNKKSEIFAELQRLQSLVEETDIQENKRLRDLIMDAQKPFYELSREKQKQIDNIFDTFFDPKEPKSIYVVIGEAAAYILRGQLTA
ncbi:hypothetical protein PRA02_004689 [Salmonella enterica]|nr:hypothetical protein [Salmonella enterica]EKL3440987.1 hypothetical protein [Salmonella enterica]